MKLFIYAFIFLFVAVVSAPVFAQKSDADAKLIEQTPADEDGWAADDADADDDLAPAPEAGEQNPHEALRAPAPK